MNNCLLSVLELQQRKRWLPPTNMWPFPFCLVVGRECVCGQELICICEFVIQPEYSEFGVFALKVRFLAA